MQGSTQKLNRVTVALDKSESHADAIAFSRDGNRERNEHGGLRHN